MSKDVVLCLNGVEFTPPGGGERVCWPWEHTRVAGMCLHVLDRDGAFQKFGAEDCLLFIGERAGEVAARLHMRKERARLHHGLEIVVDPNKLKRDQGLPIVFGLIGIMFVILEVTRGRGTPSEGVGITVACLCLAVVALSVRQVLRENVAAMTLFASGARARLHDGQAVEVRWSERVGRRGWVIQAASGIVLRPRRSPELSKALVLCRAMRSQSLTRKRRRLSLWCWPGAFALVLGTTLSIAIRRNLVEFGVFGGPVWVVAALGSMLGLLVLILRFKFVLDRVVSPRVRFVAYSRAPGLVSGEGSGKA